MAGVVDEAEDAYSSGAPGLILLVFFQGVPMQVCFMLLFALCLWILSLYYDLVPTSVFFVVFLHKVQMLYYWPAH